MSKTNVIQLVKDGKPVLEEARGSCWWWHKWSKWKLCANLERQVRGCLKCGLIEDRYI